MKFSVNREELLRPLTLVAGAVERRQTMPILSNILLRTAGKKLQLTGTDLEVELSAVVVPLAVESQGEITVPARKLLDICKSLPEGCDISFALEGGKAVLRSGRSRFSLATLAAADFPAVQRDESGFSVAVNCLEFKQLIDKTAFSMAQQDVRYYLNGMLWELSGKQFKAISTDGHRLAIASLSLPEKIAGGKQQFIVPRKGVLELSRLLDDDEAEILLEFGGNHIRATADGVAFVSKLVDGKFPDYERVLPKGGDKVVLANRLELKSALSRSAILSNEKFRGVRFGVSSGQVDIQANNPEKEEASEEVSVSYQGEAVEMGFNVSYLIDVLAALRGEQIRLTLADSNSSALLEDGVEGNNALYVVMPMRL